MISFQKLDPRNSSFGIPILFKTKAIIKIRYCLRAGDVLVSAEGQSLEGLDHKEVGEILKRSNNLVRLSVKRSQSEGEL